MIEMEELKEKIKDKNFIYMVLAGLAVLVIVLQAVSIYKTQKMINLMTSNARTFKVSNDRKVANAEHKQVRKYNKKVPFSFNTQTNLDEKQNDFKIVMDIPENITMDDIRIYIRKDIISINISKNEKKEDENYSLQTSNSFSQSFTIPETNAKFKDLKTSIENGKLTIIVPIVK